MNLNPNLQSTQPLNSPPNSQPTQQTSAQAQGTQQYEYLVCNLFQTIQGLMSGLPPKMMRRWLYYVKKMLDQKIGAMHTFKLSQILDLSSLLQQILNIFLLNLQNPEDKDPAMVQELQNQANAPQLFQNITEKYLNPFDLLTQLNLQQGNKLELIEELITLALTKKQFRDFSAEMLVVGAVGAVGAVAQSQNSQAMGLASIYIDQNQAQFSKTMFQYLLASLAQI